MRQCPKCGDPMVQWGHGRMERWRCPACQRIRRKGYHAKVEIDDEPASSTNVGMSGLVVNDSDFKLYQGDCLETLRTFPSESIDCVVSSPPYFGLRDYGADGQIGMEDTPDEFIYRLTEVFREVYRVLTPHGTCWVNLGDSYTSGGRQWRAPDSKDAAGDPRAMSTRPDTPPGLKPKDLCMVPARVAMSLQQPWYTGQIKDERDRIWLAAMVEAEGCMFIHRRKGGTPNYAGYTRKDGTGVSYTRKQDTFGAGLEITSTDRIIVDKCLQIAGIGSVSEQTPEQNARRKQTIYRWSVRSNECKWIVRELYPHMVAKQHEARLLLGCPSAGDDARKAWESLKALHQGQSASIDFPPPEGMWERGWFLRSDIIWAKLLPIRCRNLLPTDRLRAMSTSSC